VEHDTVAHVDQGLGRFPADPADDPVMKMVAMARASFSRTLGLVACKHMFASPRWDEGLDEAQLAVANHGGGPLVVVAGAGTGKTRALVSRVASLIERGAAPERILLLTFTRRAADEMLTRRPTSSPCKGTAGPGAGPFTPWPTAT